MNPTCRHLMRYRTPCLTLCRYCVTDLRDPPAPLAEKVVIHPERDVDQPKGTIADAVKGRYIDECIYEVLLLTPCIAPGGSYGDWHGRLLSDKTPWRAVVRQVRLASI